MTDTTDSPESPHDKKPAELAYSDYYDIVTHAAEAGVEALEEYGEDFNSTADVVEYVIDGDKMHANRGYQLATLLHTDANIDNPDHTMPWTTGIDENRDLTHTEYLSQMAYTAYYDDVYDRLLELLDTQNNTN